MTSTTNATQYSWIFDAFQAYLAQGYAKVEDDILSSTKASFSGGKYYLELLPDESYRVFCPSSVGNLYDSNGILIPIPTLDDDEYDADDEDESYFDNAVESLELAVRDAYDEQVRELHYENNY